MTIENTADFIRAGVDFVGVGGELVNQKLLDERNFEASPSEPGRSERRWRKAAPARRRT